MIQELVVVITPFAIKKKRLLDFTTVPFNPDIAPMYNCLIEPEFRG
jgi:hypothetical protein